MGTRNVTCVKYNGEYKVAQYGQWDGYPEGQGTTVINFLHNKFDREKFIKALDNIYSPTEDQFSEMYLKVGHDYKKSDGWISCDKANQFSALYPSLSRDTGANILELIQESVEPLPLTDAIECVTDPTTWCEWVYLIDLDTDVLEVYGHTNNPLYNHRSFAINLVKVFPLNELPSLDDFLASFNEEEEEEEEEENG